MRAHRPVAHGDVPDDSELTTRQRRVVARIRAGRPDAVLIWRRRPDGLILEISIPPDRHDPHHSVVTVAFEHDGSVHVAHRGLGDGDD